MNQQMFDQVKAGKGFIAALDQSGGSTPKALKLYGIDESEYSNTTPTGLPLNGSAPNTSIS